METAVDIILGGIIGFCLGIVYLLWEHLKHGDETETE